MDAAEPDGAISQLIAHIWRLRTQVVLTFGPDHAYGHPDHIAVSQLAASAVALAADAPLRPLADIAGVWQHGDENRDYE
jgi:N-acetyl-1-D-myo-inositol-2-amino-2-deoxy-alpha-D-glucopyranoside deacetylase